MGARVFQSIFGTYLGENLPPEVHKPALFYPGESKAGKSGFAVSETDLSRHALLLGGSGCGKTNAFCFAVRALRNMMDADDVMIIFDTKGEFYSEFGCAQDVVIGNSTRFRKLSYTWNLFEDILADGWDMACVDMNAREMAMNLFKDRGSSTQPFFCNAARDIFRGVLIHFVRNAQKDPVKYKKYLNNADLINAFKTFTVDDYRKIFNYHADMRGLLSYFGDGTSNQALGVFGELNSMLSEYFVGVLAENRADRSISMRHAVRDKGGKVIFVEYDLAVGETLSPMYRLLIDLALKEALSRGADQEGAENQPTSGRVYLIADEFKLLPKLQHIDDALNFGRGMGVCVMAGLQSIDQLYEAYGREKGAVLASGFGSIFAFHTNDASSREYITRRFGSNIVAYGYQNYQQNAMELNKERMGNTVEEWDQLKLKTGQAIIGLGYEKPFLFKFDRYYMKDEYKPFHEENR